MKAKFLIALALSATVLGTAPQSDAKTFRWANEGDVSSMDPYFLQETFLLTFTGNIYEALVGRDKNLALTPSLATEWTQTDPLTWRFKLRQGVKFHDGSPFTADDVLFSVERTRAPASNLAGNLASIKEFKKIDDYTIDFITASPDPILPHELTGWYIMSKSWSEKNGATRTADPSKNEENFATRNTNGTGPFILKERQPDVRTVLVPNPNWWGKPEHNLTEVDFRVIKNAATRVAALLSGEIDMIYTVPPQDTDRIKNTPTLQILQKPELRTIYFGFDQSRPELLESNIKGKNPFKDKRVREAFYSALDIDAIKTKVMRGFSTPTALLIGEGVNGFDPALNKRSPYDPAKGKKLLADAGYPEGFEVGMDCPNDRYVNDEAICQAAAAMLARIGININLLAQTKAKFFSKINDPRYETSLFMLGWTPNTYDAHNMLLNLAATRDKPKSRGQINNGGYSNPRMDELVTSIGSETDQAKRNGMIKEALTILKDDFAYIPLHQQVLVWAAKKNIKLVQQADNYFPLRYVTVE
jgi:peptide/nickel transport system substrate-binding protein